MIAAVWLTLVAIRTRRSQCLRVSVVSFLLVAAAHAQGVLMQLPPVTDSLGRPIAGATVAIFTASGTLPNVTCNAPVTVYKDAALSVPFTTLTTDGFGNFPFYIAPAANPYGYTITGSGTATTQCYVFSAPFTFGTVFTGNINGSIGTVLCLNSDTGLDRNAPAWWNMGNCTPGDQSGTLSLSLLFSNQQYIAAGSAAAPSHAFKTDSLTGSYLAGVSTYGIAAGGAQIATFSAPGVSLYGLDSWLFVDGSKYTTFAGALAGLPTNGGEVRIPPDRSETFTSQIDLGSATHPNQAVLGGNDMLTCNVTGGASDCLDIHNGSTFGGQSTGSTAARTGGSVLNLAATANVVNVVNSPEGANLGGQAFFGLENLQIDNANAGTVSGAMVNLQGIMDLVTVRDVTVSQCHTIGWNVTSTANSGLGPLTLDNDWGECDGNAGGRPLVITANTAKAVQNVTVNGGAYVHPGAGNPAVEVNGQNTSDILRSTLFLNTFTEDLANANGIGTKVVDATATTFLGGGHDGLMGAGAGIDISENTGGLVRGVVVLNYHCGSPGIICLNNHITGTTLGTSSTTIPLYIYGGDTGIAVGARPVTFENIEFDINNATGKRLYEFPIAGNPYFSNQADADSIYMFDGGLTAAQNVILCFQDRSANTANCKWTLFKSSGGNFTLIDKSTGLVRAAWSTGTNGPSEINSQGNSDVRLNVRSGLGTGGTSFGDGAGNTVATVSSAGLIKGATYGSNANCSSSASPAICAAAPAGSVVVAAAASTVVVDTTAVTANSQIFLARDDSLGTKLSVTCNTATAAGDIKVSARTAATSFTITVQNAPAANPLCLSYFIVN